jgi:hypothetical protein
MLRAILLASPVVLVAVVSCGDSSASFDDVTGGSAGTSNAVAGRNSGGKSTQGGNSAIAGSSSTIGGSNQGGQGNGNSGTANNGGTKNNAGSGNNGGTANQAGSAGQGGAGNAGAPTDPSGGAGAANAGAAGTDSAGAAGMAGSGSTEPRCPDLFGSYKIKNKEGMCSGLNKDAPQSIEGNTDACAAHFVSEPPTGPEGLNGATSIDADGNFSGAMLYLDMTQRNPCSGSWNAADETMTVTCGGQGDRCTVLLELQ